MIDLPPAPQPLVVAIAPAAWLSTLEPWAAARSAELRVELVALEDVCASNDGVDAPERIKRHLWDAWKDRAARYALLVGDADVFPVRYMALDRIMPAACDWAFYPSDLYYADVAEHDGSFDDWNASREGFHAGYFGEVCGEKNKDGAIDRDGVSYVPELGVGRWPVSTREQLRAVIAKTLAAKLPERPRAALLHAVGWIDCSPLYSALSTQLERAGYECSLSLGQANAGLGALADGASIALHAGHGSPGGWEHCIGPTEETALLSVASGVFFSVGCSTAHWAPEPPYQAYVDIHGVPQRGTNAGQVFTAPPPAPAPLQGGAHAEESIGERLVRAPTGGVLVYIGCATGAQPCALTLQQGFVDALVSSAAPNDPPLRVGDAWRRALAHYHAQERLAELVPTEDWYPPSIFFQGMKFVLLGDPTLALPQPSAQRAAERR
ncbi:MAG: hypothetical protein FJ299_08170 [Planctomycetes bacterium]|nr:hypothetical protein [Planctomycetota bacterium]